MPGKTVAKQSNRSICVIDNWKRQLTVLLREPFKVCINFSYGLFCLPPWFEEIGQAHVIIRDLSTEFNESVHVTIRRLPSKQQTVKTNFSQIPQSFKAIWGSNKVQGLYGSLHHTPFSTGQP